MKCTPPIGEMYDERIFFEGLQDIHCWYTIIHNDPDERFLLFIPDADANEKLDSVKSFARKQKVEPVVESIGTAVSTQTFSEGSKPEMRTIIELDGERFEINNRYFQMSKTETEQFIKLN